MCACSGGSKTNCSNITVNDYNIYKSKYQCVITNDLFATVGLTPEYVDVQLTLLDRAITLKTADSFTCALKENENRWLTDMTNIALNSSC